MNAESAAAASAASLAKTQQALETTRRELEEGQQYARERVAAADDQLEFGWVDTLYTQCSGGEAHGDGSVAPAEEVPLAALGAAARSPSRVAQDPAMMQLRARRLEMESM